LDAPPEGVQPPSFTKERKRFIKGKAMPAPVGVGVVFARRSTPHETEGFLQKP